MTVELDTDRTGAQGPPIDTAALGRLGRCLHGELVRPGHPSYDERRRVWNGSIDRHPAVIVRCLDAADVSAAVTFARRSGLPLAVRGGGHSFAGLSVCDGGVVVDLGPMKQIRVDPERRVVQAEAGVLLGELDRATQAYGLAVPLGSVTHTGLAGLTLGGGIGWLMRRYGLTVDQLLSVEMVTAEGKVRRASQLENADLFWGVRGGGGNFGIVTRFELRLHAVGPMVHSGLLLWPLDEGAEVVRLYRDWADSAPDELTTALIMRRAPTAEQVPEALRGQPAVMVASCWVGPPDRGRTVLEPLRGVGRGLVDLSAVRAFVEHQALFDPNFPHGMWVYSRATNVARLTDDVLDATLARAALIRSPRSAVTAWQLGGAVARVGGDETSFGSRSSGYLLDLLGATDSARGFEQERDWAREGWATLAPPHAGAYVNWLMEEGEDRVRQSYGDERYDRLRALKRRYDPENVFRLNQNVRPWEPGRSGPASPAPGCATTTTPDAGPAPGGLTRRIS